MRSGASTTYHLVGTVRTLRSADAIFFRLSQFKLYFYQRTLREDKL